MLLLCAAACSTGKKQEQPVFSEAAYANYKNHFLNRYAAYQIRNTAEKGDDFIAGYVAACKMEHCEKGKDYDVVQAYQLYQTRDSMVAGTLDCQLFHFKDSVVMNTVIQEIKEKNCIDDVTMRLHRIYRLNSNTIVAVSFYHFDILGYEDFLKEEFDKRLSIEVVNISW